MTGEGTPKPVRTLAWVQILAAIGVVARWIYWFATDQEVKDHPINARIYGNAFPMADIVLASAWTFASVGFVRGRSLAVHGVIAMLAGGMAVELALTDTTHNLLTSGFTHGAASTLQKLVFALTNLGVGAASIGVPWRHRSALGIADVPTAPEGRSTALLVGAAVVWLVVGLLAVHDPAIILFHTSLVPAAFALSIAALTGSHRWPVVVASTGALVHMCLLIALLGLEQRALVPWLEPFVALLLLLRALPIEFGAVRRLAAL